MTIGHAPVPDRLAVSIGPLRLRNPVMPASGCFGPELGEVVDLHRLGALVTKTVFAQPRAGNPPERVDETPAGMLNSVGIPGRGVAHFIESILPAYLAWSPPTIVSIGGISQADYFDVADALADIPGVAALEVNVSCPNLESGGLELGADPAQVGAVVRGVVDRSRIPVIVKLTPNVTSIAALARASEAAGATAISAINSVQGMAIDVRRRRSRIGSMTGGLTGPAIRPIAVRCVWQAARAVSIPVIGVGGITSAEHVIEFLLAGASAIQVGTATFSRPDAMLAIIDDLVAYLDTAGVDRLDELVGALDEGSGSLGRTEGAA